MGFYGIHGRPGIKEAKRQRGTKENKMQRGRRNVPMKALKSQTTTDGSNPGVTSIMFVYNVR